MKNILYLAVIFLTYNSIFILNKCFVKPNNRINILNNHKKSLIVIKDINIDKKIFKYISRINNNKLSKYLKILNNNKLLNYLTINNKKFLKYVSKIYNKIILDNTTDIYNNMHHKTKIIVHDNTVEISDINDD